MASPLTAGTALTAFNPSNRVDLIARTIALLTQFRIIRRRGNEELRDARRQNCELRKESEELRRMVAHYKAMGMTAGQAAPQEKVRSARRSRCRPVANIRVKFLTPFLSTLCR